MSMPHSPEAEMALLSALCLEPDGLHNIAGIVNADYFYSLKNRHIFRAISALIAEGKPVDLVSIADQIVKQGCEPMSAYIAEVAGYAPTAELAEYYAGIVKEKYARRRTIEICYKAMEQAKDDQADIQTVIATVQKELDGALPADDRNKTSAIFPDIVETSERVLNIPKGGAKNYIPTGFHDLDREVNLTKGTLTIIGASPREGKTSLILCMMRYMAKDGKRPLLFTLEMTRERVLENLIAQEAQVCHRDMITGRLSEEDQGKVYNTMKKWSGLDIGVLDGQWGAAKIRHRAIQEKRQNQLDAIFVDVLGKLLPPEGMKRGADLHKIFNANCQLLQDLSIELNIPVILTAHLNRDAARQGSRPSLFSLREAGEEFSDNVLLIHRPYLSDPTAKKDLAEIVIAKNRDGDVGTIEMGFNGPTKTFYSLAEDYREEDQSSDYWWSGK